MSLPVITLRQLASRSDDENLWHFTNAFPGNEVLCYDVEALAEFPSVHRLAEALLPDTRLNSYLMCENEVNRNLRSENEKIWTDFEVRKQGLGCWIAANKDSEDVQAEAYRRAGEIARTCEEAREEAARIARRSKAQALFDLLNQL